MQSKLLIGHESPIYPSLVSFKIKRLENTNPVKQFKVLKSKSILNHNLKEAASRQIESCKQRELCTRKLAASENKYGEGIMTP